MYTKRFSYTKKENYVIIPIQYQGVKNEEIFNYLFFSNDNNVIFYDRIQNC